MNRRLLPLLALALLGCARAHDTGAVENGIYELTVERDSDACVPARAVGAMGPVAVFSDPTGIDAPVPEMDSGLLSAPRVRLAPETLHAETNRRIPGCDGAFVHEEWTVIDSDDHGFEILHQQAWEGLGACTDPAARMPSAPEADCTSERRLGYQLETACPAPCRLVLVAADQLDCSCE